MLGVTWPVSWLKVRNILESDERYFINYSEYLEICLTHKISGEQANVLSEYLHDLGIVQHFKEDPHLKHIMVLKPEWITKAVYKVLDSKKVRKLGGVLLEKDIDTIWKSDDGYSYEQYETLLRVMFNFGVIFKIADTNNYIVTELLPPQSPEFDWDFQDNLCFQYHYIFLPSSIFLRFIVKMHNKLEKGGNGEYFCWREGAILSQEKLNARAYIRTIPSEKTIEIRIAGEKRKELLYLIREQFDYIHNKIPKLKFTQKIPCQCLPDCTYLFDYDIVYKMEANGLKTAFCDVKNNIVDINKLLNGIEKQEQRSYHSMVVKEVIMGDKYIVNGGQHQHIGPANADVINYEQIYLQNADALELDKLAKELTTLCNELMKKAVESNDKELKKAALAVGNAQSATEEKDGATMMQHLAKAGKIALKYAKEIGTKVAIIAIEKSLGL